MTSSATAPRPVTAGRILRLWWPLAGSWLLMGLELPLLAIALSRMPGGEVHLAAFGALVFPLSVLIEAPIIMLLAASTALVRDLPTHERLRRFAHASGALLSGLHAVVAFTPLFDVVAVGVLGVPEAVIAPGRLGMQIMTPWSWAIAYRRFQQGVLIRCERSDTVVVGTMIRLGVNVAVLGVGLGHGGLPGIAVGATGVACGVVAEALWAGYCFQRCARPRVAGWPGHERLRWRGFAAFYLPLAFTPLITIVIQPIGSWAMSRMPDALASLAAWPAVYGLVFLTRSAGFAYNEVVVALAGDPGGPAALRRFGRGIAAGTTGLLLLLAATPLGELWFGAVTGLSAELTELAVTALGVAVLMPAYAVAQNHYQGLLVFARRTRWITEAVVLYLAICAGGLLIAVEVVDALPGIWVTLGVFTVAGLLQTGWLARRSRGVA